MTAQPPPLGMKRVLDAGAFHAMLIMEPFTGGPLPESTLRTIAEASARLVDVTPILDADTDPATRKRAIDMTLAAIWAHGFKTGAQAAGPADTEES